MSTSDCMSQSLLLPVIDIGGSSDHYDDSAAADDREEDSVGQGDSVTVSQGEGQERGYEREAGGDDGADKVKNDVNWHKSAFYIGNFFTKLQFKCKFKY